jgi:hypothetical protein
VKLIKRIKNYIIRNKNDIVAVIFLIFCISLLDAIWFRKGMLIASGESGIVFHNINAIADSIKNTWSDAMLGNPSIFAFGTFPFYRVLSYLEKLKINEVAIQIIFVWLMLSVAAFSIFYLIKKYIVNNCIFGIFAAIFYICNFISLISVWNRLQYPFIFFYSFLPLLFLLFFRVIVDKKYSNSIFIAIVFLVTLPSFVALSVLELFWFFLGTLLIFLTIIKWSNKREIARYWIIFALSIIMWFILNAWWFIQFYRVISTTSFITSQVYNSSNAIATFTGLANRLGNLSYIFRLMNRDFFSLFQGLWFNIYGNPFFIILSYLLPLLAFYPLLLKKKPAIIYYFSGLSLLLLYLVKSNSGPFGEIYLFLFTHIRLLEAFRNSFEKFSLLLPLTYSILIVYSVNFLTQKTMEFIGKKKCQIAVLLLFILINILLVFPFWNGWLFTAPVRPSDNLSIGDYVSIPLYYTQANNWLNQIKSDFRIIALPIGGEGITQTWNYGYSGVDPLNGIFNKSFISYIPSSVQFMSEITGQLQYNLFTDPIHFIDTMNLLNAKYLMSRTDIDYRFRGMTNPQILNDFLTKNSGSVIAGLKVEKKFGALQFYKNISFQSMIYAGNNIHSVPAGLKYADAMSLTGFQKGDVFINSNNNLNKSKTVVLLPTRKTLDFSSDNTIPLDNAQSILNAPRYLPGNPLYSLIRIKEVLELSFGNKDFFKYLSLSNKRLSELIALSQANSLKVKEAGDAYIKALKAVTISLAGTDPKTVKDNYDYLHFVTESQIVLLKNLVDFRNGENNYLQSIYKALINFAADNNLESVYAPLSLNLKSDKRMLYYYDIPQTRSYELLLQKASFDSYDKVIEAQELIQIDNSVRTVNITEKGRWVSLGIVYLTKGEHEIQINAPIYRNKLNNTTELLQFDLKSGKFSNIEKTFIIKNYDPYGSYKISFDYWIQHGNLAVVEIHSDIDTIDKGKVVPQNQWSLDLDGINYNHNFINKTIDYTPNSNANTNSITFKVKPFNQCDQQKSIDCIINKEFMTNFNKPTLLVIKNLRIDREFTNNLVLRYENSLNNPSPKISYSKIDSSDYTVHVDGAKKPFYLIFLTSFHPLWKVYDKDNVLNENQHLLADSYANAWLVNKTGTYDLKIIFQAEQYFKLGLIIFIGGIISLGIIAIILYKKR